MTQRLATLYALREEHVRHLIGIALEVYQLTSQPHPLIQELCMPGNKLYKVASVHLSYWHKKGFTERPERGYYQITQAGIDYLTRHPDL